MQVDRDDLIDELLNDDKVLDEFVNKYIDERPDDVFFLVQQHILNKFSEPYSKEYEEFQKFVENHVEEMLSEQEEKEFDET